MIPARVQRVAEQVAVLAAPTGEGETQINEMIRRITNWLMAIGGSLTALVCVAIGIMVIFNTLSGEGGGGIRKQLGKYYGIALGTLTIGAGATVGAWFINLGASFAGS